MSNPKKKPRLMRILEENKISLDDSITEYLPEFNKLITVKNA